MTIRHDNWWWGTDVSRRRKKKAPTERKKKQRVDYACLSGRKLVLIGWLHLKNTRQLKKKKKEGEKETQSGATAFVLLFLSLFLWLIRARNSHRVYLVKRSRNNRARANTKGAPRKERKVAATSSVVPCLEFSPLDDICFRFSGSTLPLWREQGDSLEHCVCAPASSSSVENRIRRNLKGQDFSADSFILSYPVCCCVEQQ